MTIASDEVLFTLRLDGGSNTERLSDRALDRLRTLIVTLELEPGSLIDEASLSRQMRCGHTPLREAIYRLAEERMLVILPHRAVAVAPITISDLQQIYEARTYLECTAVRLAAQRITASQLAPLEERVQRLLTLSESSDAIDFCRRAACHFEFHYLLAKASGNQYLCDSIRRILPTSMRLDFVAFRRAALGTERAKNHAAIVEALRIRDADAADLAVRSHIAAARAKVLSLL